MTPPSDAPRPTDVLGRGRFLSLLSVDGWEYAERLSTTRIVAIWAVTGDQQLILTSQYRPALDQHVIDLPAGLCGDQADAAHETLEVAARRELVEETGYDCRELRELSRFPTSPGLTNETVTLFSAHGVHRIGDGGGDETEQIDLILTPLASLRSQLDQWRHDDLVVDPKIMAAAFLTDCTMPLG